MRRRSRQQRSLASPKLSQKKAPVLHRKKSRKKTNQFRILMRPYSPVRAQFRRRICACKLR